jgi:hypothetical protein
VSSSEDKIVHVGTEGTQSLVQRIENAESLIAVMDGRDNESPVNLKTNRSYDDSQQESPYSKRLDAIEAQLSALMIEKSPPLQSQLAQSFDSMPLPSQSRHGMGSAVPYPGPTVSNSFSKNVSQLHLLPSQVDACWQAFQMYLDPVLKIVHKPSADQILEKVSCNPTSLSINETALAFTIYFSAISVMGESNVQLYFGSTKTTLLATYSLAAENALMRLDLGSSEDILTLQTIALFVTLNLKIYKTKKEWAVTEVLRRLNCSSVALLSPFEKEIHNRISWHMWYLMYRAAKDQGNVKLPDLITHQRPLNINDRDLDPSMLLHPSPWIGWTDMSFALIRLELAELSYKIESLQTIYEKEELIHRCERKIYSCYLDHCDKNSPIYWLAHHITFVHIMETRFKLRNEQITSQAANLQTQVCPDQFLLAAINILDLPKRLKDEPHSAHWTWLLPAFQQFLPLRFLLSELCYQSPKGQVMDYAWKIADLGFVRWSYENKDSKNYSILTGLMDTAKAIRLDMVNRQTLHLPTLYTSAEDNFLLALQMGSAILPNDIMPTNDTENYTTGPEIQNLTTQEFRSGDVFDVGVFDTTGFSYGGNLNYGIDNDMFIAALGGIM